MRRACICDGYDGLTCDVAGADCALRQEISVEAALHARIVELCDAEIAKEPPTLLGLALRLSRAADRG